MLLKKPYQSGSNIPKSLPKEQFIERWQEIVEKVLDAHRAISVKLVEDNKQLHVNSEVPKKKCMALIELNTNVVKICNH